MWNDENDLKEPGHDDDDCEATDYDIDAQEEIRSSMSLDLTDSEFHESKRNSRRK